MQNPIQLEDMQGNQVFVVRAWVGSISDGSHAGLGPGDCSMIVAAGYCVYVKGDAETVTKAIFET